MTIRIRREQLNTLGAPHLASFIGRLAGHLREQFPEAADEPEDGLRAAVGRQVDRADAHGLTTGAQAAVYVTCAWLLGEDFDEAFPAARDMLASQDYTPDEKAAWLAEWAVALFATLEQD